MSFLKKASNFAFGSSGPKYNQDKAAMTSQYGVKSAIGNMSVKKNADGTYSKVYSTTEGDQLRNNLINEGLGSMSLDPTNVQQAYYDQASRLLNNQFDQQRRTTDTNLINRGIQTGTDQYNQVMGDLTDRQNATLQDLANQAVYMGDQNIGQKVSNINALGAGRDVYGVAALGGQNDAYNDKYQSEVYRDAMRNQRNSNVMSTLGGLGGIAAVGGMGSWSDKRVKENLKKVGSLDNGLKVYVGNYKKETGLDTKPQLFLLAQEVQKKHPEAVGEKLGVLTVDYKQAVKKGK